MSGAVLAGTSTTTSTGDISGNNPAVATFSHTTVAGTTKLVVVTAVRDAGLERVINSVTFDGSPLTLAASINHSSDVSVECWFLDTPAITTGNVVVTYGGAAGGNVGAIGFPGTGAVNTSGLVPGGPEATDSYNGNSGPAPLSVSASAGSVLFFCHAMHGGGAIGGDTGLTDIFRNNSTRTRTTLYLEQATTATVSRTFTGVSNSTAALVVSFAAAAAPSGHAAVKVWNGSSWEAHPTKHHDGSTWVEAAVRSA